MTTSSTPIALDDAPPAPGLDAAVDFINTTGISRGKPFDDLPTASAAVHWLHAAGYLSHETAVAEAARLAGDPAAAAAAVARVQGARAGLRGLVDALDEDRDPGDANVAAVNEALDVPEAPQLVRAGDRFRIAHRRAGHPFDHAIASIARAVADEISEGRPERFRVCQNDTCRWAFYDRSRPGTRRWCEMASCGNRMKAARHRARLRGETASPTKD